ncbi:hypothetical protein QF048_007526 [Streptomyces sp. W4I9-2]|nr:hypothetical protein [Streptomyces sp. W4I9-2]
MQTLDGEYDYFESLWHQALKASSETGSETAPAAPPPVSGPGPAARVEDLIAAFGKVLSTAGNRAPSPGRPRPAPIRAATTWTSSW